MTTTTISISRFTHSQAAVLNVKQTALLSSDLTSIQTANKT